MTGTEIDFDIVGQYIKKKLGRANNCRVDVIITILSFANRHISGSIKGKEDSETYPIQRKIGLTKFYIYDDFHPLDLMEDFNRNLQSHIQKVLKMYKVIWYVRMNDGTAVCVDEKELEDLHRKDSLIIRSQTRIYYRKM